MTRRILQPLFGRAGILAIGLALILATQSSAATTEGQGSDAPKDQQKDQKAGAIKKEKKSRAAASTKRKKKLPTITNLKVDPKAAHVRLFDGINSGSLNVKVVAQNALNGSLYIQNTSQKPLTVEMPSALVAVQVLRQFGGGGAGGGRAGGAAGGAAQSMGMMGGMGGMGGGMGGMGGGMGGMGMFSIPAERTAKLPFQSVCLEHGKADPDPTVHYKVIPVDEYTKDDKLVALLSFAGSNGIDPQAAQAAAWHLSSKMSWEELAAKRSNEIGESELPYFSPQALFQAQQLVVEARGKAVEIARQREKASETKKEKAASPDSHVIQGR